MSEAGRAARVLELRLGTLGLERFEDLVSSLDHERLPERRREQHAEGVEIRAPENDQAKLDLLEALD